MQAADRGAAAQDFVEGSGEVDPLDAFMAENEQKLGGGHGGEEEEIDPLDAFMADLAPTVRQDMAATAQDKATNGPVDIKTEDGTSQPTTQVCPHGMSQATFKPLLSSTWQAYVHHML